MAFLECDTFFFGTARRKGGKRSNREGKEGIDHDETSVAVSDPLRNKLRSEGKKDERDCWRASVAIVVTVHRQDAISRFSPTRHGLHSPAPCFASLDPYIRP